ncbi:hypothetical protein GQ42DRAFT_158801 [Ramicandelaber brevisporus]|nr:hypothetical protein GQ42DRAFT_158801 [Ramicandelaber brevisporus]
MSASSTLARFVGTTAGVAEPSRLASDLSGCAAPFAIAVFAVAIVVFVVDIAVCALDAAFVVIAVLTSDAVLAADAAFGCGNTGCSMPACACGGCVDSPSSDHLVQYHEKVLAANNGGNGHYFGSKITVADIALANLVLYTRAAGNGAPFTPEKAPLINKVVDAVTASAELKEFYNGFAARLAEYKF